MIQYIFHIFFTLVFVTSCAAQAPANDECTGATVITLASFASTCSSSIIANTQGATKSAPNPSCTSSLNDDDIWYSFQATTTSIVLRVFNATYNGTGKTALIGFSMYKAPCPSTTSNMVCSNLITAGNGYLIINDLMPGTTYYLRFWSSSSTQYATFEFCVQETLATVNDDCANATTINSQPVGTVCDASYHATTVGATRSLPDPSCSVYNDDDIWCTFTANANSIRINFSNTKLVTIPTSGKPNLGYAIYESACPSSNAALNCEANIGNGSGSELVGGLIAGHQYYLRFFSFGINNYITFDFCLVDVDVPLNDECRNALNLPVSNGFCSSPVAGTLFNATTSPGFGEPSCVAGSSSEDVWYKVTVPASGNVTIQTSPADPKIFNLVMEAYSGNCGSLSLITCDDDGNPEAFPSDLHSRIKFSGRTPGEIIYLRVLGKFNSNYGSFAICAWDHSVTVPVSPGGDCIAASPVVINTASLNKYMWVPIFDNSGKIMAEIYADGSDLNIINTSLYANNSGTVRNNDGKHYLDRNISIKPPGNSSARVRMYFTNDEFTALQTADPSVMLINNLNVTKTDSACRPAFSGTGSVIVPDAYSDYGPDHYVEFTTRSFSGFFLNSSNVVLPLKFTSFKAENKNDEVQLAWQVIQDNAIKDFEVQYSMDGINFQLLGILNKNEFIMEKNNTWTYQYEDKLKQNGAKLYRIKMNDVDGKNIFSDVKTIKVTDAYKKIFTVYPNPATDKIFISSNNYVLHVSIKLLNQAGQQIKDFGEFLNANRIELKLDNLSSGMYILKITDEVNKEISYKKLVKQ